MKIAAFLIVNFILGLCAAAPSETMDRQFFDSFIRHYESSPEGRYVHEYHPFVLDKSARSLDGLEEFLIQEKFDLAGRMVIVGYEENGVPSYYTNYKESRIDDEATRKNRVGWSMCLHNRFGFMTGFLFKSFNIVADYFSPGKPRIFEHVGAELVPIFDDKATIFQEHAFGEAFQLMRKAQRSLINKLKTENFNGIFSDLITFWQILYDHSLKIGDQEVAGTQDILFSVEYARHVVRSKLPIFHYFTGPDITYPIEITCKHDRQVSRHAQTFTKLFLQKLVPVEEKPTVYVFCSFVDGVGKSTTLGNIKNAIKHGDNVEAFEHVDNSSSQLAEVFKLKDNVFIADLPAQMSHFTYKPDGMVYVDARTECDAAEVQKITAYFKANAEYITQEFEDLVDEATLLGYEKGFSDPMFHDPKNPELSFAKNIIVLNKKDDNEWVAFERYGKFYLIQKTIPHELRVLVPLGVVKSEGLKNIDSEQMLFFEGLRFPLPYQHFLDDLIGKLKSSGISKVVFVDFMSMYPRSSRENVRINYLLQQLGHLYKNFEPSKSLYKDFVSGGELLSYLLNKNLSQALTQALESESLVRLALYKLIIERQEGDLSGLSLPLLTALIDEKIRAVSPDDKNFLSDLVSKKMNNEKNNLRKVYGLSKNFVNVQQFSFEAAQAFSDQLKEFFSEFVEDQHLNDLWEMRDKQLDVEKNKLQEGTVQASVPVKDGSLVKLCYRFGSACRADWLLAPCLKMTRAMWYAALENLLSLEKISSTRWRPRGELRPVPPLFIVPGSDDYFYGVQKIFEKTEPDQTMAVKMGHDRFNLSLSGAKFGEFENKVYRLDWQPQTTSCGIYAFGCNVSRNRKPSSCMLVTSTMLQRYQNDFDAQTVMPTTVLSEKLKESFYWESECERNAHEAAKNGVESARSRAEQSDNSAEQNRSGMTSNQSARRPIYVGEEWQRSGARRLVRMLATLEMVMRDPDADVVIRPGNREDFKAALKLFEQATLPRFFGIHFKQPLFTRYQDVEPYPSWDFWDTFFTQDD